MPAVAGRWKPLCRWALLFAVGGLLTGGGCTRRFFRDASDRDVEGIITEKNCYDAFRVENWHVYPDPRARFADPSNPDRPPMPPDDPAARVLSPNPQKPPHKAGIGNFEGTGYFDLLAGWDAENRAKEPVSAEGGKRLIPGLVAPPPRAEGSAERALKTNETPFLINLEQASELGLLNSREYQDRRENLYLSALPVSLERFAFAAQFFATEQVIRDYTGNQTPEGIGNRWRSNSALGLNKFFPTGALLAVRLANQIIINMHPDAPGPRVATPATLSLDIAQPLLQGGGFAVNLEPLTQVERNLLYTVRGYARFRKEFFVSIAGGGDFGDNFAPGAPLAPSGNATTEGYFPTLLRFALLDNEKQNVAALESILALFQALQEGGDVSPLQVDQVELDLLNSRANVISQTQQLQDALDRFKVQLGVPVSVPLALDNAALRPLIDQQRRFQEVVQNFEEIRALVNRPEWANDPGKLRARLRDLAANSPLVQNTRFREQFPRRWSAVEPLTDDELSNRDTEMRRERRTLIRQRTESESGGQMADPQWALRSQEIARGLELLNFERSLRRFESRFWEHGGLDAPRQLSARGSAYRDAVSDFAVNLGGARNERIDMVRDRWPTLAPLILGDQDLLSADLDAAVAAASQTALANRLDLQNARAQVVDAWRKIAVTANGLQGVFDVQYHTDTFTPPLGAKPFDFDASRSRHQLILNGELPLVRRAERNAYRRALIAFQRSRRTLQAAEDQTLTSVRSELRQLRFLAENYKIQQRAVELAFYQVENSLNTLQQPPRPVPAGQLGGGSSGSGGDSAGSQAALTRQVLDAVRSLLQAQNRLYTVYQSYLTVRLQLYRDLELMPLDARGVWTDEHPSTRSADDHGVPPPGAGPDLGPERLPTPRPVDR